MPENPFKDDSQNIVASSLDKIRDDTLEDSARKFERLKNLIESARYIDIAEELIFFISELEKGILWNEFTTEEKYDFRFFKDAIKKEKDSQGFLPMYLPKFLDHLITSIRLKKKKI